jgi:Transcriptional regulators
MFDSSTRIDKDDPLPRHVQVQRILRGLVASGRLRPGDKIPAELQLADALGVSKMTVNKALLALTSDGLLVREVGRGTFVAPPPRTDGCDRPGAAGVSPPGRRVRIALSFVDGARNVLDSDYYGTIYRGILDGLAGAEVEITLSPTARDDYRAEERLSPSHGRLVIAPRAAGVPPVEALWAAGKPVVVVGASWPGMSVPSVDSDNIGGAAEAVRHLLELGHRRIALFYAEEETANTQDRIVGYRRALSLAGVPQRHEFEVCAEAVWRAGEAAAERLTALLCGREREPVTAVFAAGHYLALEVMNVARQAELRVPEDVSVVGYDDPISAWLVHPPVTSIRQPLHEMGRRAAERLLRLVRGEEPRAAVREVLPPQLIVRRSTAALEPTPMAVPMVEK